MNPKKDLIQITTNGTKLSREIAGLLKGHLKALAISLNAATVETYNRDMKHGNFPDTLSAIREFLSELDANDRSKIRLHFVAHTLNYQEIPDFVALAGDLGVPNVSIGHYLVGTVDHIKYSLFWIQDEYNRAADEAARIASRLNISLNIRKFGAEKITDYQKCISPFTECYVLTNGDVGPCCFCGDFVAGNAYQTGFEDVWFGKIYQRLRKNRFLPACQNCEQFIPLDDYRAHFTAFLKDTPEFKRWEDHYIQNNADAMIYTNPDA